MKALAQLLHTKLARTKYPISSGTDRQTDGQTDGRTDRRTDGQAQPYIPSFSRGIINMNHTFVLCFSNEKAKLHTHPCFANRYIIQRADICTELSEVPLDVSDIRLSANIRSSSHPVNEASILIIIVYFIYEKYTLLIISKILLS